MGSNGKHKEADIAVMFFKSITFFGIEKKVQGITADNTSSNTTFILQLRILMDKENIEFDPEDHHFGCISHIVNLGVQEVFKLLTFPIKENAALSVENSHDDESYDSNAEGDYDGADDHDDEEDFDEENNEHEPTFAYMVSKLRNTYKKIKNSKVLTNRLSNICTAVNVPFIKPTTDVRTRWDSTCEMLEVAFKLKPALNMMWEYCPNLQDFKIDDEEWILNKRLSDFLKYF